MKKLIWFIAGLALGAVAAKQIEENPKARKAYQEAKSSVQDFRDAVMEGYREREAELAKPARSASKSTASKSKPSSK
jgi:hypothetical protein